MIGVQTSMGSPKKFAALGKVSQVFLLSSMICAGQSVSVAKSGDSTAKGFDANLAYAHVRKLVSFGPRPPGSQALAQAQTYITNQLRSLGLKVEHQDFLASTPNGRIGMKNIIARVPGFGNQIIVLGSHYDTKLFPNFLFVGANDGGSSTGLLLELARVISRTKRKESVWLVFFDGEEAQQEWTEQDSLYGSRYFVQSMKSQGLQQTIRAMVLMDMIGDKDLILEKDQSSTPWLVDLVWKAARDWGYGSHLGSSPRAMTDDHIPFIEAGIPAVDLIDFDYGFFNHYWHSAGDTIDKISPQSLKIVGDIVLRVLDKLSPPSGEQGSLRRLSPD